MQAADPTQLSYLIYGGILLAGLVALAVLLARNWLHARRTAREAALLEQRNLAIEELNKQTMELAHQEGLHMMGQLTSSIAHEFNNLLTPIMGYSMLALERVSPEEEDLYDDLLEIYEAARKAKEIISRLSSLSRKRSSLVLKFVELDAVIREVVEGIQPVRPLNTSVELDLGCANIFVFADETRLHQMMLNLCVNAFQAMQEIENGLLRITTREDGAWAAITVADNGYGIREEIAARIFDPFFTTKEAAKGTGLGLAIVQQVVNELGGEIRVESAPGEGTSMHIRLPLPQENAYA